MIAALASDVMVRNTSHFGVRTPASSALNKFGPFRLLITFLPVKLGLGLGLRPLNACLGLEVCGLCLVLGLQGLGLEGWALYPLLGVTSKNDQGKTDRTTLINIE